MKLRITVSTGILVLAAGWWLSCACPCLAAGGGKDAVRVSLPRVIEMVVRQNRSVVRARNSIQVSRLGLKSAVTDFDLKFRPAAGARLTDEEDGMTAGVSLTKRFTRGLELAVSPRVNVNEGDYYSRIGVSLAIPLLKGQGELVNLAYVRGEEYSLRTASRSLHRIKTSAILQAVRSFYDIVSSRHKVELNTFLVARFKKHADLAKLKSDIELASPLDVYRAKIKVKDAEADLAAAVEALQKGKHELKTILSIPQGSEIAVDEPPIAIAAVDIGVDEAERVALENRVEILQAQDALEEARRYARIAKHNLLPELKLNLDYTRSGESDGFRDSLDLRDERWMVSLSSSSDFARSREKLYYQQMLVNVDSALIDLEDTRERVRQEVRSQLDALNKIREEIRIREQQIHQAEGKKALAAIKFDNDMADNFDLIEAETELHRAKIDLLDARIDYIVGTYRLREIMGTLLVYHES
ncbi:MAG: TolC family protein [Deltaproteobacteria bacterium]|nr:TolC family protein [Deltaproteobacteria bacterium]